MHRLFTVKVLEKYSGPSSGPKETPPKKEIPNTNGEIDKLNTEVLSTLSNREFLRVERDSRLEHITSPARKPGDISEGSKVNFTFTFNGKHNRDLFLRTTAGQVLPPNVEEVSFGGAAFKRDGLYGEFFASTGNRLIIRDGTEVTVSKIRGSESIQAVEKPFKQEVTSFGENADIALEAKKRGIDPAFAILAFWEKVSNLKGVERSATLEDLLTDFGRAKWVYGKVDVKNEKWIYRSWLALGLLSANNKDWKEKATQYGVSPSKIESYASEGMTNMSLEDSMIDNGENLAGNALWNHGPFQEKLRAVCSYLSVDPEDMKKVMMKESGINPKARNRISNATGLIQFMPSTARSPQIGTTVWLLRWMSGVEQLTYVQKYYEPYKWRLNSAEDLYLATFYPAAIWKGDDFVMWSEPKSRVSPEIIANQNGVIAPWKSVITVADFKRYVARA